jgi:alpha-ketoglutarate-dependent taurine dioxygenase
LNAIIENVTPLIGGVLRVEKAHLLDPQVAAIVRTALEERGVIVFPQINVNDEEQLAFTDRLGGRVNFNRDVPGTDSTARDVYRITLDQKINTEPDYVLGTFFWHIDGMNIDIPLPKATVLSARRLSDKGGATEFANLYAAYEALSDEDKAEIANLRVIHTVEAAVRPVHGIASPERLERYRKLAPAMEHPLVWTHSSGRKSLLIGTHADGVVGMPGPHGRALLTRLQQWASQPRFVYRHNWQVGDLVIWDNQGLMHRVVPYTDPSRSMHRTVIAGSEKKTGRPVTAEEMAPIYSVA